MIAIAELRQLIGLGAADTSKDWLLVPLELAAIAFIERQTGHAFGAEAAATLYVAGTGTDRLYLPDAIDTPVVLERTYPGAVDTTAITDFSVRDGYLLRTGGLVWTSGYEYQVDGNTGYGAGLEPEDVKQAVRDLVRLAYNTDGGSLKSESIGGYSYTRAGFTADEWSMAQATLHMIRGYPVA